MVVELLSVWRAVSDYPKISIRWPLIKLSEFRVIIRSSTWPSSCVDSETRWVNDIDSNESKKWQAAVSLWSSTQTSKLTKRWSRDKMMGSKRSENSSIKPIIVTGLVLRVRSTIYCEKSESWWFGGDEIVGKFKRRSWTKLEFAKSRPKISLIFCKCQISSFSRSNVWMVLPITVFMILFPSFISRAVLHTGICVPFTPGLIGPRLLLSALLSRSLFLLCLVFWIVIVHCIILLLLYESYPIKLLKKNKRKKRTHTFASPFGATK